ncbi:MAG: 6-phosphogluconolactonase [Acidobacteria bacterium]|nr:6-phosphogluconolactonase [Acidobacteriota bacterium]
MRGTLIICADYESLSREAARRFVAAVENGKQRAFYIALAGGGTPRRLYELLASSEFERRVPWERVHFFWGDERLVPRDHPQSNYKLARESLLRHVRIPPKNIHPVGVNLPLEQAAAAYEQEVRSVVGGRWTFPVFDLILLGLGDDGHTASLFPRAPALQEKQKLVTTHRMPGTEPARVTLTLPVLNAAKRVFFLVSGECKATALRTVVEGTGQLPAHLVAPKGELLWLADTAAAGKLKGVRVQPAVAEAAH